MVQLRLGPSGPPIQGDNIGDVLIWDGHEWEPGPQSGGSSSAFRSQFENDQTMNLETVEDVDDAAATFTAVPAGAYIFVQCVLNVGTAVGAGFCNVTVVWDFGDGDEIIWEPGPVIWLESEENPTYDKVPLQFQTPALEAPAASVNVRIQANGAGIIRTGHFQAELISA